MQPGLCLGEEGWEEGLEHKIEFFCSKKRLFVAECRANLCIVHLKALQALTDEALQTKPTPPETIGVLGQSSQSLVDFCKFFKKLSI